MSEAINLDAVLNNSYKEFVASLKRLNIAIIGNSGAGKSTLINSIFGELAAETGIGSAVTKDPTAYRHKTLPITLWDTPGIEISGARGDEIIEKLKRWVDEQRRDGPIETLPHLCWFVIPADSLRLLDGHIQILKALQQKGVATIVVLNKFFKKNARHREFLTHCTGQLAGYAVVSVNSLGDKLDDLVVQEPFGLEDLCEASFRALPNIVSETFEIAQRTVWSRKERKSIQDIMIYSAAAGLVVGVANVANLATTFGVAIPVVGMAPLPLLLLTMCNRINFVVGLPESKLRFTQVASLLGGLIGQSGHAVAAGYVASELLGVFPFLGASIKTIAQSGLALLFCYLFGRAYLSVVKNMRMKSEPAPNYDDLVHLLREDMKLNGARYRAEFSEDEAKIREMAQSGQAKEVAAKIKEMSAASR